VKRLLFENLGLRKVTGKAMAVSLKPQAVASYQPLLTMQECSIRELFMSFCYY